MKADTRIDEILEITSLVPSSEMKPNSLPRVKPKIDGRDDDIDYNYARENYYNLIEVLSISDDFPAPAGPVMPITTDLPEVLNIFLINFLDSFSSFSKIEIAFAIAPRFAFFKSEVLSMCNYLLFLR